MKSLREYREKKSRILEAYDRLLGSEALPKLSANPEEIRRKRKQLEDEQFVLAVCGQMKAGKSTLLNALVFGRPVLPSDVTTMTAKNTFLRHGDKPNFEATFYTEEEWRELRAKAEANVEVGQTLQASIEQATSRGAYKDEFIEVSARTVSSDNLNEITKFVGTMDNGGVYTPYVKSITIYTDHPWLEDVVIADTPGVNDTNPHRDKLTKDWIHRANAVVYMTYAGRAIDEVDKEFIDRYLMHVPGVRRLIAVNKIDAVNDPGAIESWLDDLRASSDRFRVLLGAKESNYLVCALGGLIERMESEGLELTPKLEQFADLLEPKGFLDSSRHRVGTLQEAIGARLVETSGEGLLQSHVDYLDSTFELRQRELEDEKEERQELLQMLSKNREGFAAEIQRIKEARKEMHHASQTSFQSYDDILGEVLFKLSTEFDEIRDRILKDIQGSLRSVDVIDHFETTAWKMVGAFDSHQSSLFDAIKDARNALEDAANESLAQFKTVLHGENVFSGQRVNTLLKVSAYNHTRELRGKLQGRLSREVVRKYARDSTNFFQRLIDTQGGLKNARAEIESGVAQILEKVFRGIRNDLESHFRHEFNKVPKEVQQAVNEAMDQKQVELERAQEDVRSLEEQRSSVRADANALEEQLAEAQKIRQEIHVGI